MRHIMHLRPGVAKQANLELKTRPKKLLGSLPLVIALPGYPYRFINMSKIGKKCFPPKFPKMTVFPKKYGSKNATILAN